ncbi:MAG: hypothetical protein GF353_07085, partial [Candidatus Lokiarchaeota archaeon]|nr:hypothetical protein [Candidatus Lokiarchaeota archaeon]
MKKQKIKYIIVYCLFSIFAIIINSYPQQDAYIMIDPGHGGDDVGAVGKGNFSDIYEKVLNLDYSQGFDSRIFANAELGKFKYSKWHSLLTRDDNSVNLTLLQRTRIANGETTENRDARNREIPEDGVDLFISIHCNACGSSPANGTEVYYTSSGDIDRKEKSIYFATLLYQNLMYELKMKTVQINNEIRDNDSNSAYYYATRSRWLKNDRDKALTILRNTNMPAILLETEFIDNAPVEAMITNSFAISIAEGLKNSLIHLEPSFCYFNVNFIDSDDDLDILDKYIEDQTIVFMNPDPPSAHGSYNSASSLNHKTYTIHQNLYLVAGVEPTLIFDDEVTVQLADGYYYDDAYADGKRIIKGHNAIFNPPQWPTIWDFPIGTTTDIQNLNGAGDSDIYKLVINTESEEMRTILDIKENDDDFDIYGRIDNPETDYVELPSISDHDWSGEERANGVDETVPYSFPEAGDWYIMVYSHSGAGDYDLTCYVEEINVLNAGISETGTINSENIKDTYKIEIGDRIESMHTVLDYPTSADFKIYGKKDSPPNPESNDFVWTGERVEEGKEESIYKFPEAGTWYLKICRVSGEGDYAITCNTRTILNPSVDYSLCFNCDAEKRPIKIYQCDRVSGIDIFEAPTDALDIVAEFQCEKYLSDKGTEKEQCAPFFIKLTYYGKNSGSEMIELNHIGLDPSVISDNAFYSPDYDANNHIYKYVLSNVKHLNDINDIYSFNPTVDYPNYSYYIISLLTYIDENHYSEKKFGIKPMEWPSEIDIRDKVALFDFIFIDEDDNDGQHEDAKSGVGEKSGFPIIAHDQEYDIVAVAAELT